MYSDLNFLDTSPDTELSAFLALWGFEVVQSEASLNEHQLFVVLFPAFVGENSAREGGGDNEFFIFFVDARFDVREG